MLLLLLLLSPLLVLLLLFLLLLLSLGDGGGVAVPFLFLVSVFGKAETPRPVVLLIGSRRLNLQLSPPPRSNPPVTVHHGFFRWP